MKYKAKDYAEALVNLISKEMTPAQEKKLADNFLNLLKKNGDSGKASEIIDFSEILFFKKTGRKKIILETARKMSSEQREIFEVLAKEGNVVREKINEELIAGIKIIVNDEKQLDFSMLKKIQNIF
ncbi:MAG: F0F1 ATP synthase subunit delta [Candidatus Staskawiczbacteria bacterium]|nr:F0F1 ATP synthase subunit delta [Candidatus Staskawiczbacteria bacterium]